jgi:DNA-binding CsgD family transcriptional regulator
MEEAMRSYLQAYTELFQSACAAEKIVKQHIENHLRIEQYLPDSAAFFYVVEFPTGKYHFLGKQQEFVSGYSNEEFSERGVELFLARIHPEEINTLMTQVYPDITAFIATLSNLTERRNLLIQYNYRLQRKNGEYINLLEHVHILETDDLGRASLVLGNVIMLQNAEVLPMRLTIKKITKADVSETVFSRAYTSLQSQQHVTTREMEILGHLAGGKTSREIGRSLCISPNTVDTHRRNLLKKLKCKTVVELTRVAFANALL